jgi:palmitoyltransferase
MTTLENLTHSYPSVLLESEAPGHAGTGFPDSSDRVDSKTKTRRNGGDPAPKWRPDHLLTRQERTRLRREARRINVYDKGWRVNILEILGDGPWWTLGWPLTRVPKR